MISAFPPSLARPPPYPYSYFPWQAHYSIHILKAELRFALFSESVLLIGGSWSCLPFRLVFSLVHPMSIGWYWMHKRKRNFGRQNSSEPPTQSKGRTLTIEHRAFVFPLHHCLTFASQKMICIFRQRSLPSFLPSFLSFSRACHVCTRSSLTVSSRVFSPSQS